MSFSTIRVLWAIDLYSEPQLHNDRMLGTVEALFGSGQCVVEPVYVYEPYRSLPEGDGPEPVARVRADALQAMGRVLSRLPLPGLEEAKLLPQESGGLAGKVDTLVAYARQSGASLILLAKRQRRSLKDYFFNRNFTEQVMLNARLPAIVVTPECRIVQKFSEVLFATDFSESCFEGFRLVLPVARALALPVRLFYRARVAEDFFPPSGISAKREVRVLEDLRKREEQIAAWRELARAEGVAARESLELEPGRLVESLLAAAGRLDSPLIAIVSQHGPLGSLLFGKGTRELLRKSPYPVWVTHLSRGQTGRMPIRAA